MAEGATTTRARELIEQLLGRRGLDDLARANFLAPDYDQHLHDPYLMTDMEAAVERILLAAKRKETVVVYGDYDIDGITASAVMIEGLAAQGIKATSYIPDRFEEGYGINQEALEALKAEKVDLVISVDCGVTSGVEAAWAREHGLDLIITDHHAVPETIPDAIAVINPKRLGDKYPFKDLAGVGVAFKLVQALQQRTGKPEPGQEKWLLDLVALGTVCDVVSLVGENRVLAQYGLKVMAKTRRPGLRALAAVGGVEMQDLASYHLGFVLGPRMNAAGRLEHAARSLELMQTTSTSRAHEIALELDRLNLKRRDDQTKIFAEADGMAELYSDDPILVLANPNWSHGIVGIVASKIMEKWRKPTLVMQILGKHTKGSARSIGTYDMVAGLRAVSEHFIKFGGHYFAAGYTLPTERIDSLRQALNDHYRSLKLAPNEDIRAKSELELADLALVDWDLWVELERLEPHGNANPRPVFETGGLELVEVRRIGKNAKHYKLRLKSLAGEWVDGIAFGLAEKMPELAPCGPVRIWYHLGKNNWNGKSSIQYVISHLVLE